jgi:hypothetical protein
MTLIEMIRKRGNWTVATATPATPVTKEPMDSPPVADVADVAAASTESVTHITPSLISLKQDGAVFKGHSIASPVLPGWLVTYQDSAGRVCGGSEDRAQGTVQECCWEAGRWTLYLTDGQQIPLWRVRAVGQTDANGRIGAAWTVREHGYDGNGPVRRL